MAVIGNDVDKQKLYRDIYRLVQELPVSQLGQAPKDVTLDQVKRVLYSIHQQYGRDTTRDGVALKIYWCISERMFNTDFCTRTFLERLLY